MLISDEIDFKFKKYNKVRHYILIKGLINPNDIIIINTKAPISRTPKYIKQTLTELGKEVVTIITEDFNTLPLIMDRTPRQKSNKYIEGLNNTITN